MWQAYVHRQSRPMPISACGHPELAGGEGGIRTHGELAPTAVFKTAALNHSATSPDRRFGRPANSAGASGRASRTEIARHAPSPCRKLLPYRPAADEVENASLEYPGRRNAG